MTEYYQELVQQKKDLIQFWEDKRSGRFLGGWFWYRTIVCSKRYRDEMNRQQQLFYQYLDEGSNEPFDEWKLEKGYY